MNRRSFVEWSAMTLGGSVFGIAAFSPQTGLADALRSLFYVPDAATTVGRRYLVLHPGAANSEGLMSQLGIRYGSSYSRQQLANIINLRREQDFRDGKVVVVDGWILARSEAAVCALVALI